MRAWQLMALGVCMPVLIAVAGCSVHRSEMSRAALQLPAHFIESDGAAHATPLQGKWWERFRDERLNALMEESFLHNPDLERAYSRFQQLDAIVHITDSSRSVFVNLNGSGGRVRQPVFSGNKTSDSYNLSLAASYEVDLWNRLGSSVRGARLDALASSQDIKTLYLSLSAQLAEQYYLAVEQRAQLELSDRTIASFEDTLKRVEERYREGLVSALDVYQSRQNLASARAQKSVFESNLAVAGHALSVLLGRLPEKEISDGPSHLPYIEPFPPGMPSDVIARRADIEAALLRLKASDEKVGAAIADRFPSFNLVGTMGGASEALGSLLNSSNIVWNVLLNISQPVLDGGRRSAEVERTKAVFRENLALYHKAVLHAFQEVEDALARSKYTEERIALLEKRVEAASGSLRLATDRYMLGLSDYLPVLTAQQQYYEAESALLSARRQLVSDRVQLARSLGDDWTDSEMENRSAGEKGKEGAL